MPAQPTFGGVNVAEMNIGQPGSARYNAGTANYTANVRYGPEERRDVEQQYPQQNFATIDKLGGGQRTVRWVGRMKCSSRAVWQAIQSELLEYEEGRTKNFATGTRGAFDELAIVPDKLVDRGGGVITTRAVVARHEFDAEHERPDGTMLIPSLTVTFRVLE